MSDRLAELCTRREGITIPTIWVALALSLLIHSALLWQWRPQIKFASPEPSEIAKTDTLVVRLAAPPSPPPTPPSPALSPQPSATPHARPPKAMLRPRSASPPIALNRPAPDTASSPATPSITAPARSSSGGDLTSYIEAQRSARAASAPATPPIIVADVPPAETDEARTKRIVAANLAQPRMTFGYDPSKSGGVFTIQRTGYDDAEFMFYGWNGEIRRNIAQLIEVKRGNNSTIHVAVVRKMIAIIREQVREDDFLWQSQRLGRSLTLSARAKDNAELEGFLLLEFFYEQRPR